MSIIVFVTFMFLERVFLWLWDSMAPSCPKPSSRTLPGT